MRIDILRYARSHFSREVLSGQTLGTHLKKFLKIFPGLSLLPPGVVGVPDTGTVLFALDRSVDVASIGWTLPSHIKWYYNAWREHYYNFSHDNLTNCSNMIQPYYMRKFFLYDKFFISLIINHFLHLFQNYICCHYHLH